MDKTIRIAVETYERIKQLATKEKRNIKTIVDMAIEKYFKNRERR